MYDAGVLGWQDVRRRSIGINQGKPTDLQAPEETIPEI